MKHKGKLSVSMRLLALVKPLTGHMLLAIGMGTIGHLCAAFITVAGGYAVLGLLHLPSPFSLRTVFIALGVMALLRGALRFGEQTCNHYIAFKLLALIRDRVFRALRRLCPAKLAAEDKGNLISVITSDVELLEVFYAHTVSPVAIALLVSVLMSLFIGAYHAVLGGIAALAYIIVGVLIPLTVSARGGADGLQLRTRSGNLSSFVLESLRGLRETLQYGTGRARLETMNAMTGALSREEEKIKRRSGYSSAVTTTVIVLFDLLMLLASALLYQNGSLGFDGVLIPVIALMSSFGPVIALANLGGTLQNTFAAGTRVLDILDETPAVEDITGEPEIGFTGAAAEAVGFSYGGETVLSDLSVDIPRHSVVGITGRSGSGKSTLLRLFMRFWAAQKGKVMLSGTDVNHINTRNLRNMESFMTQETHLFRDSVKNNVRIAKPDADDAEITAACKKASVHYFIRTLPKGYDTPVGELGDTLSGGERQRIGLARAFLHDAPLMLLDEPTSNLDSLNEAVVLRSVREERGDKTVVLVSHRQSTMRIADMVCSVENGRNS